MAALVGYRSVFVASQSLAWLGSQLLRVCFAPEMHRPPGVFDRGLERCLILTPTHQSVLDPFLHALREGDVVAIFPEGETWKKRHPPIGDFAPGVIYLQRQSGAAIVPMAIWMSQRWWPRWRYIIEVGVPVCIPAPLDLEAGATWLRQRTLELYERARRRGEHGR